MIMEKQHIFLIFLFLYVYQFNGIQTESLPVVLWHGMGKSFYLYNIIYIYINA